MREIVAKNIRTDAVVMLLDSCLDDKTKQDALGKLSVTSTDLTALDNYFNPRNFNGIDEESAKARKSQGEVFRYIMNLINATGDSNPIDATIHDFISAKAKHDYGNVLNGMWKRFADKKEFDEFFPNFKIVENGDSPKCEVGASNEAFSRLTRALSDFSQLKDDNETRGACTSLMQRFQRGGMPISEFESSIEEIAEGSSLMLDTKVDEENREIWMKFDHGNVFLKSGGYVCYKLDDKDKEDLIHIANDTTKWCVAKWNNTHWEEYGAPYYMIATEKHIPLALLNISTKKGSVEDPYVQFMDDTDTEIQYDRPTRGGLIEFAKKITAKIGIDLSKVGHGYNDAFRESNEGEPKEPDIKRSVMRSDKTSVDMLEYLAFENQDGYDEDILSNPNCSVDLLRNLAWRSGFRLSVMTKILSNEKCPDRLSLDVLRHFSKKDDYAFYSGCIAVLSKKQVSSSLVMLMVANMNEVRFHNICASTVKTDKIAMLLDEGDLSEEMVLEAMKQRADLPLEVLEKYAEKYDSVRTQRMSMEAFMENDVAKICKGIRSVEDLLATLKNRNCPVEVLEKAISVRGIDEQEYRSVLRGVVNNINCTSDILCKVLKKLEDADNGTLLIYDAVSNPNADEKVYEQSLRNKGFMHDSYYVSNMFMRDNFPPRLYEMYLGNIGDNHRFIEVEGKYLLRSDISLEFIARMVERQGGLIDVVKKRNDFEKIVEIGSRLGIDLFLSYAVADGMIDEVPDDAVTKKNVGMIVRYHECSDEFLKKAFELNEPVVTDTIMDMGENNVAPFSYIEALYRHFIDKGVYNDQLLRLFNFDGCTDELRMKICEEVRRQEKVYLLRSMVQDWDCTAEMLDTLASKDNVFADAVLRNPRCSAKTRDRILSTGFSLSHANAIFSSPKCTREMLSCIDTNRCSMSDCLWLGGGLNFVSSPNLEYADVAGLGIEDDSKDKDEARLLLDLKFMQNPHCSDELARSVIARLRERGVDGSHELSLEKLNTKVRKGDVIPVIQAMIANDAIASETILAFIDMFFNEDDYYKRDLLPDFLKSKRVLERQVVEFVNSITSFVDARLLLENRHLSCEQMRKLVKDNDWSILYGLREVLENPRRFGDNALFAIALVGDLGYGGIDCNGVPWKKQQEVLAKAVKFAEEHGMKCTSLKQMIADDAISPVTMEEKLIPSGSDANVLLETTSNRKIINATIAGGSTESLLALMKNENVTKKLACKFAEKSNDLMEEYYNRFGLDGFVLNSVRFFNVFKKHGADFGKDVLLKLKGNDNDDVRWLATKFYNYLYDEQNGLYANRTACDKYHHVSLKVARHEMAWRMTLKMTGESLRCGIDATR